MLKFLLLLGLIIYVLYRSSGFIMRVLLRKASKELEKKANEQRRHHENIVYEDEEITIRKPSKRE